MWIFAVQGFVSIVEDKKVPGNLLVRGRLKGDVEALFPGAKVSRNLTRDYMYRTSLPREEVAVKIAEHIASIDYDNFKSANPKDRHWLTRIWDIMYREQERDSGIPGIFSKPFVPRSHYKNKKKQAKSVDTYGNLQFPWE